MFTSHVLHVCHSVYVYSFLVSFIDPSAARSNVSSMPIKCRRTVARRFVLRANCDREVAVLAQLLLQPFESIIIERKVQSVSNNNNNSNNYYNPQMPGIASATGLLSARVQPIRRPKPKVRKRVLFSPESERTVL